MPITRNKLRAANKRVGETMAKVLNTVVEGLNPSIHCHQHVDPTYTSRDHVPVGMTDPFTSSFVEKKLDTEFGK